MPEEDQSEWMFADLPPLTEEEVTDWQKPVDGHQDHHCEACPVEGQID